MQNVPQERSPGHSRSIGLSHSFGGKCEVVCSPCNSGGQSQALGNVHDIREYSAALHDAVAAVMLSAYTTSSLSSGKILDDMNFFCSVFISI